MKTFIFMMFLLSFSQIAWSLDSREIESIRLIKSLVEKLQENKPFYYSDKTYLLGYMEFTILSQLGYQDKARRWLKAKPKYSYMGELLRKNRELIVPNNSEMKIYASTTTFHKKKVGNDKIFVFDDDKTFVYVTLEWTLNADKSILLCTKNGYRVITFKILALKSGYKKLYLDDTLVNGKPLPYLLGFRRKKFSEDSDLYVPYLPKKDLDALKLHISKLK